MDIGKETVKEYEQILPTYEKKKHNFQNATMDLQKEYDKVLDEYNVDKALTLFI